MKVYSRKLEIPTSGRAFVDVTDRVSRVVDASGVREGLVNVFVRHTSASLVVQENADPDVRRDLERFLSDLVPDGDSRFRHDAEGPDDMPAHVRSALTLCSIGLPIRAGRLALGTWQAVYLWEHRHRPHARALEVTVIGA